MESSTLGWGQAEFGSGVCSYDFQLQVPKCTTGPHHFAGNTLTLHMLLQRSRYEVTNCCLGGKWVL